MPPCPGTRLLRTDRPGKPGAENGSWTRPGAYRPTTACRRMDGLAPQQTGEFTLGEAVDCPLRPSGQKVRVCELLFREDARSPHNLLWTAAGDIRSWSSIPWVSFGVNSSSLGAEAQDEENGGKTVR